MTTEEAIDMNVMLKCELVREGRLEKAKAVQLGIEALKRLLDERTCSSQWPLGPLPGETED